MFLLVFLLTCVCLTFSLPISSPETLGGDEVNIVVLGLIIMGMGAILVACVRCRRKKRGFELNQVKKDPKEFKNEQQSAGATATVEALRSEFPIFQALSTPSSPQFQQFENESSKDSRDDLTLDRGEILDETAPSAKRELMFGSPRKELQFIKNDLVGLQTAPEIDCGGQVVLGYTEYTQIIERETDLKSTKQDEDVVGAADIGAGVILESVVNTFELDRITVSREIPQYFNVSVDIKEEPLPNNPFLNNLTQTTGKEIVDDTNFESSIEEALMILDIAIGEEEIGDDHSEDEDENNTFEDKNEFESVLRELVDNLSLSKAAETNFEKAEVVQELVELPNIQPKRGFELEAAIKAEATIFVDNLLAECCEKMSSMNNVGGSSPIERPKPTDAVSPFEEAMEEVFFKNVPTTFCQSTPSTRKTDSVFCDRIAREDAVPSAKHQLFSEEGSVVVVDATFAVMDATFPLQKIDDFSGCQIDDKTLMLENSHNYLEVKENKTMTPVNTPNEINQNEDKDDIDDQRNDNHFFVQNLNIDFDQPSTSKNSGWFLHPQAADETFDVDEFPPPPPPEEEFGLNDDEDYDYAKFRSNNENLNSTFDALRKQLADMLPHAQGGLVNEFEYGDDDDANLDKEHAAFQKGVQVNNLLESMFDDPVNVIINNDGGSMKRSLSPIMEESEEETTIKTFVLIDTKNLDSTSTGCIETLGEAVMGVTKTLMASNDTLFNFEDTLGEDATTPTKVLPNQTVNDSLLEKKSGEFEGTFIVDKIQYNLPPLDLSMKAELVHVADIASPEQQKTFSEEINSLEHISNDGTYTTNTIEMETCISLNKDDNLEEDDDLMADEGEVEELEKDERISEISEPDYMSSLDTRNSNLNNDQNNLANVDCNSLCDVPDLAIESSAERNEETGGSSDGTSKLYEDNISIQELQKAIGKDDLCKEGTVSFLDSERAFNRNWSNVKVFSGTMDGSERRVHLSKKAEFADNTELCDAENNNVSNEDLWLSRGNRMVLTEKRLHVNGAKLYEDNGNGVVFMSSHNYLSGEEDPWVMSPKQEEECCFENMPSAAYALKWSKREVAEDDEDSENNEEDGDMYGEEGSNDDSSEEFMYVKGTSVPDDREEVYNGATVQNDTSSHGVKSIPDDISEEGTEEDLGNGGTWASHVDQIPIVNHHEMVPIKEDNIEDASDAEGEFIPSCWNSAAQPVRSAMKSPDKSSSDEDNDCKARRNVAFKTQRYHHEYVYEYPREVVPLSPAYSEPQMWDKNFPFNYHRTDDEMLAAENDIDGFMVSSTQRPFHNSQFLAQCNTWPSDGDFSWSQHQGDLLDGTVSYTEFREIPIEWPKKMDRDIDEELEVHELNGTKQHPLSRPDSGVESAELLNEPILTLGDLCHAKVKLKLPISLKPIMPLVGPDHLSQKRAALEIEKKAEEEAAGKENDTLGLPTPSCTGSMDSLSSSSCSDRPISFATFGKVTPQSSIEENSRNSGAISVPFESNVMTENLDSGIETTSKLDNGHRSSRVSDSTDEDSGIENFTRIVK